MKRNIYKMVLSSCLLVAILMLLSFLFNHSMMDFRLAILIGVVSFAIDLVAEIIKKRNKKDE